MRVGFFETGEAHQGDILIHRASDLVGGIGSYAECHVLADCEPREKPVLLKHHPPVGTRARDPFTVEESLAFVISLQARNDPQQGTFAAAAAADDADEFPSRDGQVNVP